MAEVEGQMMGLYRQSYPWPESQSRHLHLGKIFHLQQKALAISEPQLRFHNLQRFNGDKARKESFVENNGDFFAGRIEGVMDILHPSLLSLKLNHVVLSNTCVDINPTPFFVISSASWGNFTCGSEWAQPYRDNSIAVHYHWVEFTKFLNSTQ